MSSTTVVQAPRTQAPAVLPQANDPCWCGSGRKYKRCHKRTEGRVLHGRRQPDARRCRRASAGRRTPTPASSPAGTSRGSSRPRSSSGCASAGAVAAEILRLAGEMVRARRHHRRDRRLRPRAAHRARRLPVAAQLQRLPEERVHLGQRGDLPRHPRLPGAAGRRHRQPRRHRLHRRRARRHQRHVLRRRRRPGEPRSSCGSPRSACGTASRRSSRAARSATSAGRSRTTPRPTATASIRAFIGHGIGEQFHGDIQVLHYYDSRGSHDHAARA